MNEETNISKPLSPEDIRPGMHVAVLTVMREYLWVSCADEVFKPQAKAIRMRWLPEGRNEPLKVMDVCLPFVFVKRPSGEARTLDVRRHRLALLDPAFAKRVCKQLKRNRRSSSSGSTQ